MTALVGRAGLIKVPTESFGLEESNQIMADDQLARDIDAASRLSGKFKLRSGQVTEEYFDKYKFESDPKLLRRVARRMLPLIPQETEILAGLELGGVPIATAMSLECGLTAAFVRKKPKEYGTCRSVEGGEIRGRKVVIVEDVITTGGAVVDAAALIHAAGGLVLAVVCAIWRGEGLPRIEGLAGMPVFAALTRAELTAV
jgi:orotate phosphoribosyltransferase